jgi:hypothetical protein
VAAVVAAVAQAAAAAAARDLLAQITAAAMAVVEAPQALAADMVGLEEAVSYFLILLPIPYLVDQGQQLAEMYLIIPLVVMAGQAAVELEEAIIYIFSAIIMAPYLVLLEQTAQMAILS